MTIVMGPNAGPEMSQGQRRCLSLRCNLEKDPPLRASSATGTGSAGCRKGTGSSETVLRREYSKPDCNIPEGTPKGTTRLVRAILVWGLKMAVFVIDCNGAPLMPCTEKHARKLLERGRAVLFRFSPFSIRLTHSCPDREILQDLTLKISPGSDTTGFALVREEIDQTRVVFITELVHRGWSISKTLWQRRCLRHRRRANLRYRTPGPSNHHKPRGWIAPSILHRIETVTTWVRRFTKLAPITCIVAELSSYNGQELRVEAAIREDREQEQTRSELRRVVFATWGPTYAYSDVRVVPVELDHIVARSCGGSDRPYNRIPSCQRCNKDKGKLSIDEYLATDPERMH